METTTNKNYYIIKVVLVILMQYIVINKWSQVNKFSQYISYLNSTGISAYTKYVSNK